MRTSGRLEGVGGTKLCFAHNNSLHNVLTGLHERVFGVEGPDGNLRDPPRPVRGAFECLRSFRAGVVRHLGPCSRVDYEGFLSFYKGSKLRRYTDAVESLLRRPVEYRDAVLRVFVKLECVFKELAAPRVIQPRSPRFNVELGRFLRPIEHRVYAAIDAVNGFTTVAKGMNAQTLAKAMRSHWEAFNDPVAIGLDASRFDQHVSQEALEWEHSVYKRAFSRSEGYGLLLWLLGCQLENCGVARLDGHKVKYKTKGCRMSGDMNTALGNCLIMCALVHAYAASRGVTIRYLNNGDDVIAFMERRDLEAFSGGLKSWFLKRGFTMAVEPPSTVFERCEFCQTRPVYDGTEWVMVRNPARALLKDGFWKCPDVGKSCEKLANRWAGQVGRAGLSLAGGIPVYDALYRSMANMSADRKRVQGYGDFTTGLEYMSVGMDRQGKQVTAYARYSYWLAFGVTPDEQVAQEEMLASLVDRSGVRWLMSPANHRGHELFDIER